MTEVKRAVYAARAQWRNIGYELGFQRDDVVSIEQQFSDSERCLEEVLTSWLTKPSMNPSWQSLTEALNSKMVNRSDIAEEIGM